MCFVSFLRTLSLTGQEWLINPLSAYGCRLFMGKAPREACRGNAAAAYHAPRAYPENRWTGASLLGGGLGMDRAKARSRHALPSASQETGSISGRFRRTNLDTGLSDSLWRTEFGSSSMASCHARWHSERGAFLLQIEVRLGSSDSALLLTCMATAQPRRAAPASIPAMINTMPAIIDVAMVNRGSATSQSVLWRRARRAPIRGLSRPVVPPARLACKDRSLLR